MRSCRSLRHCGIFRMIFSSRSCRPTMAVSTRFFSSSGSFSYSSGGITSLLRVGAKANPSGVRSRTIACLPASSPNSLNACSSRLPNSPWIAPAEFAYLQLDRVELADAHFEAELAHAFQLLALKRLGVACPVPAGAVKRLGRVEDCELLVCNEVNADAIKILADWPQKYGVARLAVYSTRPDTLRDQLAARGVEANCYSLMDALLRGQGGNEIGRACVGK